MAKKFVRLLVVDDDSEICESYNESIKTYNRDRETTTEYKLYTASNYDKAMEYIQEYRIDVAIIDLNLSPSNENNSNGYEVIKEIRKYLRLPIFVVSGNPDTFEQDKNKSIVFFEKDGNVVNKLLEEDIPQALKSKVTQYFLKDGYLEREIAKTYWKHIGA